MPKNKYKELNRYQDANIQYIIANEYDGTEESLEWISTGYMILTLRQKKDYTDCIIQSYIEHIICHNANR